ncbi:MAG: hypothetical protein J5695_04350 [Bacteroidales bacterium]|nr:hypothetical protein [Bacteroidales bacterium]
MEKWEDIIREKLESYDSPLPEGSFAEFHARLASAAEARASRRFPMGWVIIPAIVASLAILLIFRHQPDTPVNGERFVEQPTAYVKADTDSSDTAEPVKPWQFASRENKHQKNDDVEFNESQIDVLAPPSDNDNNASQTSKTDIQIEEKNVENKQIESPLLETGYPNAKPIFLKIAPAAGIITGGGLLATIISSSTGEDNNQNNTPNNGGGLHPGEIEGPIWTLPSYDKLTGPAVHYLPIKVGVSTWIPVTERLRVSTGLEYSVYNSKYSFRNTGEKIQTAHYLGIPVHLDWLIVTGERIDVYIGGGVHGDYSIAVAYDGKQLPREGGSLSLLGTGGVQMNITKRLGIYAEPQISWRIPSERHVAETYRSENPLMFSVATGLRINIEQ